MRRRGWRRRAMYALRKRHGVVCLYTSRRSATSLSRPLYQRPSLRRPRGLLTSCCGDFMQVRVVSCQMCPLFEHEQLRLCKVALFFLGVELYAVTKKPVAIILVVFGLGLVLLYGLATRSRCRDDEKSKRKEPSEREDHHSSFLL